MIYFAGSVNILYPPPANGKLTSAVKRRRAGEAKKSISQTQSISLRCAAVGADFRTNLIDSIAGNRLAFLGYAHARQSSAKHRPLSSSEAVYTCRKREGLGGDDQLRRKVNQQLRKLGPGAGADPDDFVVVDLFVEQPSGAICYARDGQ
jgi:hypothetical protein